MSIFNPKSGQDLKQGNNWESLVRNPNFFPPKTVPDKAEKNTQNPSPLDAYTSQNPADLLQKITK